MRPPPIPTPSPSKVKKGNQKPQTKTNKKTKTQNRNQTNNNNKKATQANKQNPQKDPEQLMHHKFRSLEVFSLKWYRSEAGVEELADASEPLQSVEELRTLCSLSK